MGKWEVVKSIDCWSVRRAGKEIATMTLGSTKGMLPTDAREEETRQRVFALELARLLAKAEEIGRFEA